MAVVEYEEVVGRNQDGSIYWQPLVDFAWKNTKVGDVVTGVLPVGQWSTEAVAIRVTDDIVAVTSKPISTSLIPDGGLWRTGTYAGCHICVYYKDQEEHDYLLMTVYSNPIPHYVVFTDENLSMELLEELGNVLRQYALDYWFLDDDFSIQQNKQVDPGLDKQSYRKVM